jgi:hypothetical protein
MLGLMPEHPEITFRRDALLMSINDRLGALLPPEVNAGADMAPLTTLYLDELLRFAAANAEDQEEALDEAERSRHG